ncbi:hypothetical protein [Legionella cincinnatiensis]|uniref:Ankyrin repeat protein n=1 Tax=Legionella cincinnatiensis TaxID=28085 RepID=A0A378IK03_9GAMM|nr:hypothetical protein [Legionella cincinnatiensis]KTC89204.1 ankyrin repeat protein [Legionella cincinnatiensis]STX35396.1 ankyrin repeat protein [Legionella cincinnatiensis]
MSKRDCYTLKLKLNVTKIPVDEREANIFAIYSLLSKEDLFKGAEGILPQVITKIKNIIENIDLDNEIEICESILKIKEEIKNHLNDASNSNLNDLLTAFNCTTNLTYKTILSFRQASVTKDRVVV